MLMSDPCVCLPGYLVAEIVPVSARVPSDAFGQT